MDLCIHQNKISYKLEVSKKVQATSFAGCALIRESLKRLGLTKIMKSFGLKKMGYGDDVILEALILLLASGGRSLSDWDYLKGEFGFERMFGDICPSVDTLERYLRRLEITIPQRSSEAGQVGYTTLMEDLQKRLIHLAWKKIGSPKKMYLDIDTMIIETNKSEALYCYEKVKAYQPMNAYSPDLGLLLAHEFRDGNVSPMEGYQRLVERCQELLPEVLWIVRSDSAGYNNDFMDWMTKNNIAYVITARETQAMQEALTQIEAWLPLILNNLNLGEEIAEVTHVPAFTSREELKERMRLRRYFAIQKTVGQKDLFNIHQVIVTNDLHSTKEKIVQKHRGRCGSVEHFHSQINQLGMDMLPSNNFKVNAGWYSLGCFVHNLLRLMQTYLFPEEWKRLEIRTFRFRFLRSVAIVIKKARRVILKFCENHPIVSIYQNAWEKLTCLSP